jgi:hypothetical protein
VNNLAMGLAIGVVIGVVLAPAFTVRGSKSRE